MRQPIILLTLACTAGCVSVRPPPRLQTVRFDRWSATYRAYPDAAICEAEPQWLFDELTSVNGVLDGFLDAVPADDAAAVTDRQLRLLEESGAALPPLIADHRRNLEQVRRCPFASRNGYPKVIERGEQLAARAAQTVSSAERTVEAERGRRALRSWREQWPRDELSARLGCDRKAKARPVVYFAYDDESGTRRWLFCDGAKVVGAEQGASFEEPGRLTAAERRRLRPADYLDTAREYPLDRISRPPLAGAVESAGREEARSEREDG